MPPGSISRVPSAGEVAIGENMQIIENLWQVGGDGYTSSDDAAVYLVRFGQHAALIDAGCGSGHDLLIGNISACLPGNIPITTLFLTHCHFDHTGGAEALRHHYGCRIVAHKEDAVYLESGDSKVTAASWYGTRMEPLKIDLLLHDPSQTLTVGEGSIKAYHWPGHSPGSVIYTTELDGQRVLFGQDVHGPIHPDLLSDRTLYQQSLKLMLSLNADILCEGHFGVIKGKNNVRRFIGSYLEI